MNDKEMIEAALQSAWEFGKVAAGLDYCELHRVGGIANHYRDLAYCLQDALARADKAERAMSVVRMKLRSYATWLRDLDVPFGQIEPIEELLIDKTDL